MYDLIGQQYGISQINSHIRGNKQIDFILGAEKVVMTCAAGGILPFHEVITSDHRGLYIDIDWGQLLGAKNV
eukprot:8577411-Ditylum_brightwellii.AAC.1